MKCHMKELFVGAYRKMGMDDAYHINSIDRYIRTAKLAYKHYGFNSSSCVGELGPGLLLPYYRLQHDCQAHAYGLITKEWQKRLQSLGIDTIRWDLNRGGGFEHFGAQLDIVFFCEVIEHLNRWPIDVLSDIRGILKKDGILILTTVNFLRLSNRLRMIAGRSPLINLFEESLDGVNHIREYCIEEMSYYLNRAGFSIIEKSTWAWYPNGLIGSFLDAVGTVLPGTANYFEIVASNPR